MEWSIQDLGALGEFVAAMAVLITLVYLSLQVRQGNRHAKAQARQRMVEQAQSELYTLVGNDVLADSFSKEGQLSPQEQAKLNFFLASSMRQREWEWFQYQDGSIDSKVYEAYHGVILVQMGSQRGRRWWASIGKTAFDPDFVSAVDSLLAGNESSTYFKDIRRWDN